jgi:hypothetical protein
MSRVALALGLGLGGVLLAAALAALDWRQFLAALARVQPLWLALAAGLVPTAALLRALRWRAAAAAPAGFAVFWRAANLGNLGNAIYPLRAGEAIRIAALARLAGLDASTAAASSALDRAAEGLILLALGVPALLLAAPVLRVPDLRLVIGCAAIGAAVLLLALSFEGPRRALGRFVAHLRALATARRIAPALALTLLAYACDIAFTWAVLRALQLDAGLAVAIVANVFLVFAGLLPAAPAGLGAHQAASALALALFGIGPGEAIAFSALAQALTIAAALLLGLEALRSGSLRRASAAG